VAEGIGGVNDTLSYEILRNPIPINHKIPHLHNTF
jgi:hypothetical protein